MEEFFRIATVWAGLCLGVAFMGKERRIGFGWALGASILLTPLVGLIIVLCSERLVEVALVQQQMALQKAQLEALKKPTHSVADELQKLVALRDSGALSQEEFDRMRTQLVGPAPVSAAAPVEPEKVEPRKWRPERLK